MLSDNDNALLCRVGPGTPMGGLMRQYWIPALMSTELPAPDCPPLRLRLLGENLIAFRATSGRVGIVANACPHRGASLFFGRNEEEGLRCVYHGWKFDAGGNCVDMPSEPAESNFRAKVKAVSYETRERNGVVWVYTGPRPTAPPLPEIEPNMAPEGYSLWTVMRRCNFIQALEGDIDTSHLAFLHLGALRPENAQPGSFDYYTVKDRTPRYSVVDTDVGTSYAAYRPAEADSYYWRVAHFLFPFYSMIPTGVLGVQVLVRAWVPIDDEHTMFWSMSVPLAPIQSANNPASSQVTSSSTAGRSFASVDRRTGLEVLPSTSGWFGRWRLEARAENDYFINREEQKSASFTGIPGILTQDQAITESMGPIYDRSNEHLGTSDSMIIRTRRRLIRAAIALRDEAAPPPGVDRPELYAMRSGGVILPRQADWLAATAELRRAFVDHPRDEAGIPVTGIAS